MDDGVDFVMKFIILPLTGFLVLFCLWMLGSSATIQPQKQYETYKKLVPNGTVTYDEFWWLNGHQRAILLSGNLEK